MEHHSDILFAETLGGLDYMSECPDLCLGCYNPEDDSLDIERFREAMIHFAMESMHPSFIGNDGKKKEDVRECTDSLRSSGLNAEKNADGSITARLSDTTFHIIPHNEQEYELEVFSPSLLFTEQVDAFSTFQFNRSANEMNGIAREFGHLLPDVALRFAQDMSVLRIEDTTKRATLVRKRRPLNSEMYAFIFIQKALIESHLASLAEEFNLHLDYSKEEICKRKGYEGFHCKIRISGKNGIERQYNVNIYNLGEITGSILETFMEKEKELSNNDV